MRCREQTTFSFLVRSCCKTQVPIGCISRGAATAGPWHGSPALLSRLRVNVAIIMLRFEEEANRRSVQTKIWTPNALRKDREIKWAVAKGEGNERGGSGGLRCTLSTALFFFSFYSSRLARPNSGDWPPRQRCLNLMLHCYQCRGARGTQAGYELVDFFFQQFTYDAAAIQV